MKRQLLLLGLFISIMSCSTSKINSEKEYFRWINDEDNRLIITKKIDGVTLSVKYLPVEYLVYREMKDNFYNKHTYDSLFSMYNKSRTFLLTFGEENNGDDKPPRDIMYRDITNKEEYNNRLTALTFDIGHYIKLKTDSNNYIPVLHAFENTYGISPNRSIYLVFALNGTNTDDLLTSKNLYFMFDDQVFLTGISYFTFRKSDLENIPHINFWKR